MYHPPPSLLNPCNSHNCSGNVFLSLLLCCYRQWDIQSQGHPLQQPCHVLKMISSSTSRTCCFDPKEALSNLAVRLVILDTFSFALKETYWVLGLVWPQFLVSFQSHMQCNVNYILGSLSLHVSGGSHAQFYFQKLEGQLSWDSHHRRQHGHRGDFWNGFSLTSSMNELLEFSHCWTAYTNTFIMSKILKNRKMISNAISLVYILCQHDLMWSPVVKIEQLCDHVDIFFVRLLSCILHLYPVLVRCVKNRCLKSIIGFLRGQRIFLWSVDSYNLGFFFFFYTLLSI